MGTGLVSNPLCSRGCQRTLGPPTSTSKSVDDRCVALLGQADTFLWDATGVIIPEQHIEDAFCKLI